MKTHKWITLLFVIAALYDAFLGAMFVIVPAFPFNLFGVAPPYHMGFVQFPGALLLIFGLMFVNIARNPVANRSLIVYGILLKVAYSGVSGWYWLSSDISGMWKPFCVIDLIMAVLFLWAYSAVAPRLAPATSS